MKWYLVWIKMWSVKRFSFAFPKIKRQCFSAFFSKTFFYIIFRVSFRVPKFICAATNFQLKLIVHFLLCYFNGIKWVAIFNCPLLRNLVKLQIKRTITTYNTLTNTNIQLLFVISACSNHHTVTNVAQNSR